MAERRARTFKQLTGTGKAVLIVMCVFALAPRGLGSTMWKPGDRIVLLKDVTLYAEDPRSVPIGDRSGRKFDGQNAEVVSVTRNPENGGTVLQLRIDGLAQSFYAYDSEENSPRMADGVQLGVQYILLSEWKKAQTLVGKPLWRGPDTDPYGLLPETKNLAKFVVTGAELCEGMLCGPVVFNVKSAAGAAGKWDGDPSSLGTRWYTSDPRRLHPSWSKRIWKVVEDGQVCIGMTPAQATMAWGKPKKVNRTTGRWGVHEQRVYGTSDYLYFEKGRITAFQN